MSNGNFELQVHIADVAHYVREGSAIDLEARLRGTSVYFPDRAVPMLPIELSTDLCSLRPQVDRLVLSCVMEIDHQGEIVGYTLNEGVIRSAERMTYTNVNLILEGDAALRQHYHRLVDVFELMRELAMILNRKRVRRGSIDFDLPEPVIEFDENGLMKSVTRSERNIANRIIEEFMLSANECVASYLENKRVASLYRIHEKPDPKRVYDFETIAAKFGYSLGVGALPVKRVQMQAERRERYGSGRQAADRRDPRGSPHHAAHVSEADAEDCGQAGGAHPVVPDAALAEAGALLRDQRRPLRAGRADVHAFHFAHPPLSRPHRASHSERRAARFAGARRTRRADRMWARSRTARRRRRGRSASHRARQQRSWTRHRVSSSGQASAASALAMGGPIPEDELHDIAEESSQSERRADDAERELMEWKKVKFMEQRIGEEFDGLIVSVTKFGMFVELIDMFIEGLVPLGSLTDDRYLYHENTRQIIGQRTRKTYSHGRSDPRAGGPHRPHAEAHSVCGGRGAARAGQAQAHEELKRAANSKLRSFTSPPSTERYLPSYFRDFISPSPLCRLNRRMFNFDRFSQRNGATLDGRSLIRQFGSRKAPFMIDVIIADHQELFQIGEVLGRRGSL